MKTTDFEASFDAAPPLTVRSVLHTKDESIAFKRYLIYTILRIVVKHGGPAFQKFAEAIRNHEPSSAMRVPVHKTVLQCLIAFGIDESTITGNAEVVEAILKETHLWGSPDFLKYVRIFAGDQLSLARLRAILNIRAGHEGGYTGYRWALFMPGLFHAKIADIHGFILTHWGRSSMNNPGSLAWHNYVLNRSPITLTSLPPFRTCRDIAFVSLYARVLHCLLKVTGTRTLATCGEKIETLEELEGYAARILDEYANSQVVYKMRRARTVDGDSSAGDVHFENGALFLRDALYTRLLTDAVKMGDSGQVVLVLKMLALSYRGNGRSKYAYEMLHLIHNLEHVWPKPLR
jgi:hypothetical protein